MKILITGGAGFIGSHISKQLLDSGYEVVIFDNLSKGHQDLIDSRSEFVEGDLSNEDLLVKSLSGVDTVIHLASLIEVPLSVKEPLKFAQNNILGSIHLFEAMVKANVKNIIFSSSAVVYGDPKSLPIKEDAAIWAVNPYAASKISVESFLSSYNFLHDFNVTILRYFNPFGPNEMHEPETHAIPNFIKAALENKPIPLYWKGEQVRDFIYVEDLAGAHIALIGMEGFNVFNVGSESGVKVIDVINTISKIMGKKLEIDDLGNRLGDVPANYASSESLQKTTGWKAKYSLQEGLEKTIEWFEKN